MSETTTDTASGMSKRLVGYSAGAVMLAGSVNAVRNRLIVPHHLNDERAKTFKSGAILKTAAALALERGGSLTLEEIRNLTELNRTNTSYGVNYLHERSLANRAQAPRLSARSVDNIWASCELMIAASQPAEFPNLQIAMQQLAER